MTRKPALDFDGAPAKHGDVIRFCYGIPPVGVTADVIEEGGILMAYVHGNHKPEKATLHQVIYHTGGFGIVDLTRPENTASPPHSGPIQAVGKGKED